MKKLIVLAILAIIIFGRCATAIGQSTTTTATNEEWIAQGDLQSTVDCIALQWEPLNQFPSQVSHDNGSILMSGTTAIATIIVGDSITAVSYTSDQRAVHFMGQLQVRGEILQVESAGYHFHFNGKTGYFQLYCSRWTDDGFVGATPLWRAELDINDDLPAQAIIQNNLAIVLDYSRGTFLLSTSAGNFDFPLQSVWSFPNGRIGIVYSDNFSYVVVEDEVIKFCGE